MQCAVLPSYSKGELCGTLNINVILADFFYFQDLKINRIETFNSNLDFFKYQLFIEWTKALKAD